MIIILPIVIVIVFGGIAYFLFKELGKEQKPEIVPLRNPSAPLSNPGEGSMEQKLKCSQCGLDFPATEIITYENHYVCGGCKTAFVQRLREGASLSVTTHFAGFWIRVGAVLIDGIILFLINWAVSFVIYHIFPKPHLLAGSRHVELGAGYFINLAFSLLLGIFYKVWFIGTYGATIGKMACGIKIVMADGRKVGYGRAFGRYWAEMLSGLILGIGYIMVGPDMQKRALHDRICNTRVVYK